MNDSMVTPKRLYRSRQDRVIAGVAGGLGQYFNLDPVLVRLGFVFLTFVNGLGLLAYIIMAIVVPLRPPSEAEPVITSSIDTRRGSEIAGIVLLGLGLLLLAGNLGLLNFFNWVRLWPLLLIAAGIALLLNRSRD